jgi:hypothetical protein
MNLTLILLYDFVLTTVTLSAGDDVHGIFWCGVAGELRLRRLAADEAKRLPVRRSVFGLGWRWIISVWALEIDGPQAYSSPERTGVDVWLLGTLGLLG